MGVTTLPDEILSLICQELGQSRRLSTLYHCAQSSKSLADPALRTLYQYHHLSRHFIETDDVDSRQQNLALTQKFKHAEEVVRQWTILWRSIIVSALADELTYKPYCRYIRTLNFDNFVEMLEDPYFRGNVRSAFFENELESFEFPLQVGRLQKLDGRKTIDAVGQAVAPKSSLLEHISGDLAHDYLATWLAFAPHLKSMASFSGKALHRDVGVAIGQHCKTFTSLTIFGIRGDDADDRVAECLQNLNRVSLTSFDVISTNDMAQKSMESLGLHHNLQVLKLNHLTPSAVRSLGSLRACTKIHTLRLYDNTGVTPIEEEAIDWLRSCTKLRELDFINFGDGDTVLAQVLTSPNVRLRHLFMSGYVVSRSSAADFHAALSLQADLEYLELKGDGMDATPDDLMIMVDAIAQLSNLRNLIFRESSDEFKEHHVIQLALSLRNLEELMVGGDEITSHVLDAIVQLKHLKSLRLDAMAQFTVQDLQSFVTQLDPETQRGFYLCLLNTDPDCRLDAEEQESVEKTLQVQLGGRFDYAVWREESTDSSDDD